jgi:hypothetical protein
MRQKTMLEKISLKKLSKDSQKKITLCISTKKIDCTALDSLAKFFCTSSKNKTIEYCFIHASTIFTKSNMDLMDLTSLDRMSFISKLLSESESKSITSDNETIKLKAPLWQLMLITSQSENDIHSESDLINTAIHITLSNLNFLFGEQQKE